MVVMIIILIMVVMITMMTMVMMITMMMVVMITIMTMVMIIVMNREYKRHYSDLRDWASGIPYCGHNASCLNSVMDLIDIKYN